MVLRNALPVQNKTASEAFPFLMLKNVPLRIKMLRELWKAFELLAFPLLNAAQPDPVCPVSLTSSDTGLCQNKQLNPA
jgi:hypothetical protein